jgi:hypothetical protein
MTKKLLLKNREDYYNKVNKWFVSELAKWSKKHNTYLQNYSILKIWTIGSDDVYEPYSNWKDEKLEEQFKEALKDYQQLVEDLVELGVTGWQGLEYSENAKFLH